jgi:hypothetical protein
VTDNSRSGPAGEAEGDADGTAGGVNGVVSPALTAFPVAGPLDDAANAQPATMTAMAVPAVAAISRFRISVALTLPRPPILPKNDTARSPQP